MNKKKSSYFLFGALIILLANSCYVPKSLSKNRNAENISGKEFYKTMIGKTTAERETFVLKEILKGNMPSFVKKFTKIKKTIYQNGKTYRMVLFVLPDYLSIGSDKDFARIPLTPKTAQIIADSFHCFLPTRKIVDIIYEAAKVKLEPVPMYAFSG